MYKKLVAFCLCVVTVMGVFGTSAFANVTNASEAEKVSFNIDLPFAPGETRTVVDGDFLFVVRDYANSKLRGGPGPFVSERFVDIYDILKPKVYHGQIRMAAYGTTDGTVFGVTSCVAYVHDKPSASDLRVTSTRISQNNTSYARVYADFAFTADNGKKASGSCNFSVSKYQL